MDKKLLDKLNGFNLSMQQKTQLIKLIKEAGGGNGNSDSGEEYPIYLDFNNKNVLGFELWVCLKDCLEEIKEYIRLNGDSDALNGFLEMINLTGNYISFRFVRPYESVDYFTINQDKAFEIWYIYTYLLKNKTDLKITVVNLGETPDKLFIPLGLHAIWKLKRCDYTLGSTITNVTGGVETIPLGCNAEWSIDYHGAKTLYLNGQP